MEEGGNKRRALALLALSCCIRLARGHPACLDDMVPARDVTQGVNDYRKTSNEARQPFCSLGVVRAVPGSTLVLDDGTCCDFIRDREIMATHAADMVLANITSPYDSCYAVHASLLCSECHPFAGHLYEANSTGQQVDLSRGGVLRTNETFAQKWRNACKVAPLVFNKYWTPSPPGGPVKYLRIRSINGTADDGTFAFPFNPVWYWGTGGAGNPPSTKFDALTKPDHVMQMRIQPDDNYWWLINKYGLIYKFENTPTVTSMTLILDIQDKVFQSNSEGLLDISFDPLFATNKVFYAFYCYVTYAGFDVAANQTLYDHWTRLSRFIASDTPALTRQSELTVMQVFQTSVIHKAGSMQFHNGHLYLAQGDGGGNNDQFNSAQDMATVRGKILRMTINPATGKYTGTGNGGPDNLLIARGIRNPHRMSIDPTTNELWWGEVGQSQREEVNMIKIESTGIPNMGWPYWEGKRCNVEAFNIENNNPDCSNLAWGLTRGPMFDYCHEMNKPTTVYDQGDCYPNYTGSAVIGGYVYRGSKYPLLNGSYIYIDYRNSEANVLLLNRTADGTITGVTRQHLQPLGRNTASMAIDKDGELYYVSHQDLPVQGLQVPCVVMPLSNCGDLCGDMPPSPTPATSKPTLPDGVTLAPTVKPTRKPTPLYTPAPTRRTLMPTVEGATMRPTRTPTFPPTLAPSGAPTLMPTTPMPTTPMPTVPTAAPTEKPTKKPRTAAPIA